MSYASKVLWSLSLCVLCASHVVFIDPVPRSSSSGIKAYPCGADSFGSGPTTTVSPGSYRIQWRETINHPGAPYRFALSINNDDGYSQYVLVDQLPHNDNASPELHAFDIDIPDIDCPNCSLQMLSIMTDKIPEGTCCYYPSDVPSQDAPFCTSVYHSCADIAITGSGSLSDFQSDYSYDGVVGPYTQLSSPWTLVNGTTWMIDEPYTQYDPESMCGVSDSSSFLSSDMTDLASTLAGIIL